MSTDTQSFRPLAPGMGQAVAERTVLRKVLKEAVNLGHLERLEVNPKDPDRGHIIRICQEIGLPVSISTSQQLRFGEFLRWETWGEVAHRVALGNASLAPGASWDGKETVTLPDDGKDYVKLYHHLRNAALLMSGRHLQHGDITQSTRNMEVFTNCATAAATFLLFYLLLNGSGVGRAYDDKLIVADFNKMPIVVPVIDWDHPDVANQTIAGYLTRREAEHLYAGRQQHVFEVPDDREGWAKAIEHIEKMSFHGAFHEDVLILDFTKVRAKGLPIMGMQGRPASGPGPLMSAIRNIGSLRNAGMAPWRAAMYADHYVAECVLVGGARRAARMATKSWRDDSIFDFIALKRGGFLWSSNNSVTVDRDFREGVKKVVPLVQHVALQFRVAEAEKLHKQGRITQLELHAYKVLYALAEASYYDGTGEPGLINQDRLKEDNEGIKEYHDGEFASGTKYQIDDDTIEMMQRLYYATSRLRYTMIVNPCGEIALLLLGGYCVIADVVPFHALNLDDAEDAFRTAVRALIRTNLMDCLYHKEVKRTNRIGVGITGFHEWAYSQFGFTWYDIVDEEKSRDMWLTLSRFKRAVVDEAERYSKELGVEVPHTNTTFKPAGTTSKLFGLTEGAHLPPMREFLRWVQFRSDDPLVAEYKAKGYPTMDLKSYEGTTVVGFPTKPTICELDGGDWVVTAAEATPEEQYQFLRLLEKYWIVGVAEDGSTPLADTGNQVSYTLKYDPKKVGFEEFFDTLVGGQFTIRCCSVMPQEDKSAYEYLPESPISKHEFEMIAAQIAASGLTEDIGLEHIDCSTGGCPVDFVEDKGTA